MKYCQVHPRRRRKLFFNNYYKLHNYRPWHSKNTSSTFTFTGWAEWLGASKVVDIWSVLITVSWYRNSVRWLSKYFWWLGIVTDRHNYRSISYGKVVEFKIMRETRRARRVIIPTFRRAEFCQQGTASWNPMGGCLHDERTKGNWPNPPEQPPHRKGPFWYAGFEQEYQKVGWPGNSWLSSGVN